MSQDSPRLEPPAEAGGTRPNTTALTTPTTAAGTPPAVPASASADSHDGTPPGGKTIARRPTVGKVVEQPPFVGSVVDGEASAPPAGKTTETPRILGTVHEPKLPPLQQLAGWFAGGTALVLGLVLWWVVQDWVAHAPPLPTSPTPAAISLPTPPADPTALANYPTAVASYKALADASFANYKAVNDELLADYKTRTDTYVDGKLRLIDSVPSKILYPLLTLLLGYLFGIRTEAKSNNG
jgi:hypothetical protein